MSYCDTSPPAELRPRLSTERLGTYIRHAQTWGCDPIELYTLGIELAASYLADLSLLEVIMRNAMHEELTKAYHSRWWADDRLLDERSQSTVSKAWSHLRCREDDPPGKLLAQLPFGFWVHLMEAGGHIGREPYRQRRPYESLLWRPALRHAFPNSSRRRADVLSVAQVAHATRNRIAHHEPVLFGIRRPGFARAELDARRGPREVHEDLIALARMISAPVADWMMKASRTPALLNSGLLPC